MLKKIGRILLLLVIVAFCGYFFILRPNMITMAKKSKLIDLPSTLKMIQMTLLQYAEQNDIKSFPNIAPYPSKEGLGENRQVWKDSETEFTNYYFNGESLVGETFGSFWVEGTESGFTAYGISDIEGDGVFATFQISNTSQNAKQITGPDVF